MKQILLISFIAFALFSCVLVSCSSYQTEVGSKIGTITKCAREGLLFKTYECDLIRGRIQDGSGAFGSTFHFTAKNENLFPILSKALDDQSEVKINYHTELFAPLSSQKGRGSFVDEVIIKK